MDAKFGTLIVSMADFVTTTINYGVPPADGARAIRMANANAISGKRERNFTYHTQEAQVENMRGKQDTVSLDTAGFQFYTIPTKYKGEFLDDEEIRKEYYPESAELLKKLTGASKVVVFDHTVRRDQPNQTDPTDLRPTDKPQPVQRAHVDQTFAASIACVRRHLPSDEVPALLERRFQIINMWRPISVPALSWPLALCDFRSVDLENDVFTVSRIYPDCEDLERQAYIVKHNPNHKWKYVRGMTPDDIVLFKCTDSIQNESIAKFTPHTAFQDPTTPEGTPHRQSIEIRALVFYD